MKEPTKICQRILTQWAMLFFDANDLQTIVARVDQPFLRPDLPHEVTGQYKAGTCFAEALVWFKEKWWLYYGTADSFIGVAVSDASE